MTRAAQGRIDGVQTAMVDSRLYRAGSRTGADLPLPEAARRAREEDETFVWVWLHRPDGAALAAVAEEFGLPELAVEDAEQAHQRPKLESYGNDVHFVVLKSLRYLDPQEVVVFGEVMVFLGERFVVTVGHGDAPDLAEVRRELERRPDLLAHGPAAVLWAVADLLVDGYTPALEGVEEDVDEVESQVFSGGRLDPTPRIHALVREVLAVSRAVHPLALVTEPLTGGHRGVPEALAERFRDVHDHLLKAVEQVHGLETLLNSVLEANAAQVAMRQNEDMRKISAYAAILAVCTTVAGIYGMNFENMPELGWAFGYPFALLVMFVPSVLLYRGFKRNGWL